MVIVLWHGKKKGAQKAISDPLHMTDQLWYQCFGTGKKRCTESYQLRAEKWLKRANHFRPEVGIKVLHGSKLHNRAQVICISQPLSRVVGLRRQEPKERIGIPPACQLCLLSFHQRS